jgi:type I restriction enzyme, S subunit
LSFPKYPEYRDSGVEWLGYIPAHWSVEALKRKHSIVGGSTPKADVPKYWDGDIAWATPADLTDDPQYVLETTARTITIEGLQSCSAQLVPPESVILSSRAPIGSLALTKHPAATNQGCRALIPNTGTSANFVAYALSAAREELNARGAGSTFLEISGSALGSFQIALPPITEQRAIVMFLNAECTRLRRLITQQERLIQLLNEKRQALITRAVTKGLNSAAPMKPTQIDWLEEIPAHWHIAPLMRLVPDDRAIMYGIVLPGPDVDAGVPIVKGGDVAPGRLTLKTLKKTTFEIEAAYVRSRLKAGDLVYAIRGSIGAVERVPNEIEGANLTQDAARIAPRSDVDADWLLWALRARPIFAQLDRKATGATIRGINIFDLKRVRLPVPPIEEQTGLAKRIVSDIEVFDALERDAFHLVELLEERRTAVISAAVTGKIDVRSLGGITFREN